MSDLQKRLQMSKLPPMPPAGIGGTSSSRRQMVRGKRDYNPVAWDKYYDVMKDLKVSNENTFRVYQSGTSGPVCLFLHGGGFSALSWAVLSKTLCQLVECRCAAIDTRGHGDSYTADDLDLSAETQANDIRDVVHALFEDDPPPIVLVGHSMGGAIAVHTAARDLLPSLIGLCVIDVVEGTALDALGSMQSFLRGRPTSFRSLEHAIEWCVRTGQVRNRESAKVSMVGQVKRRCSDRSAASEVVGQTQEVETSQQPVANSHAIMEEEEEPGSDSTTGSPAAGSTTGSPAAGSTTGSSSAETPFKHPGEQDTSADDQYTWRVDLTKTDKYWKGWFEGLSQMFLSCSVPKMLLLAGVDRLDRDLTVGQMQGKFQMQVLPQVGHAVHEDSPDKVADVLATFLVRHKFAEPTSSFERTFPAC